VIASTIAGGKHSGLASLSHTERRAAENALSKIKSASGNLGSNLGGFGQSATLIGGSLKSSGLSASTLMHGVGSDTFIGGARSSLTSSIGSDTVVSGSAKLLNAGADTLGAHNASNFALSSDTIHVAGATALSVKAVQPEDKVKAHSVSVGDKTTVTISGLSTHDISKLSH
jgi:hypothetical protein